MCLREPNCFHFIAVKIYLLLFLLSFLFFTSFSPLQVYICDY